MAKAFSKTKKVLAVLIALALTLASGCAPKGYTERIHTTFSSTMTYSAKVLGGNVKSALDEIDEMLDAVDKSVNIHRSDSLLTAFNNAKANERVEVDKHAYEMALVAKEAFLITDGAFNVSLGALSRAWGVDAEGVKKYVYGNEKIQSLPSAESCASLLAQADLSALTVTEDEGKYYLTKTNDALTLDFGGLAKGYCADKCKEIALKHGVTSALFQISGNIMLIGEYIEKGNARDWGVGVINPRQTPNTSG
ncbi:MAG: FAD:protein FMN transferase, partial [Clostridia bacterium]|nr:FAD:protein FMN transferase [Clostridia bacterium]